MAKIVKIKQSDIEKIVNNLLSENLNGEEVQANEEEGTGVEVMYAINPTTKEVYIVKDPDSDNPTIVGTGQKYQG